MKEKYTLYNTTTGAIVGQGRNVDRKRDATESRYDSFSAEERVNDWIDKNPGHAVLWEPNDFLVEPETHLVESGKVAKKSDVQILQEANDAKSKMEYERLIQEKIREMAIEKIAINGGL